MDVKDNGDGTYSVEYVPERPGRHSVDVKYGGRRVPKSPFRVQVKPSGDASKVEIDGLGPDDAFLVGKENDFTVDCTKAGKGQSFGIKLFKKHFFFTRQTLCAAQLGCEGRSFPHPRSSCFEGRLALTQGQILIQVFLFLFPKPFRVIFFIFFKSIQSSNLQKVVVLNSLQTFLVLKSCFTLTPGYLNPALIIPAQKYIISLETGPEAL